MPEICRFYGIVIKMFFKPKEHEPSHLHALYGEHIGIFDLKTMKMTEGDLPTRAQQLVQEWMSAHQDTVTLLCEAQHNSVYLIMVVMRRTDVKTAPGEDSWRSCFT